MLQVGAVIVTGLLFWLAVEIATVRDRFRRKGNNPLAWHQPGEPFPE
jgi:hypothetical protein